MFKFFNYLISGFSTVKKTHGGRDYRFRYQGKPVFFDSIGMLKEFAQRMNERDVQKFELKTSRIDLDQAFLKPGEKSIPKVVSLYSKKGSELKVSRYVSKEGILPLSLYCFESDGVLFGVFRRTYDYGSTLLALANKLAKSNQCELESDKGKWIWLSPSQEIFFLEKFGHTQSWYFLDKKHLDFWLED